MAASSPPNRRRDALIAFGWALAEATFFFIVPDVFLTRIALVDVGRALRACGYAVGGALLGGTALWFAAAHGNASALLHASRWIPGITNDTIAATGQALQRDGVSALLVGAFAGKPYKLFALHAGAQEIVFMRFLAASLLARLTRFFTAVALAGVVGRMLRYKSHGFLMRAHILFWFAFYAGYFALVY